jgi:hypothetical protein
MERGDDLAPVGRSQKRKAAKGRAERRAALAGGGAASGKRAKVPAKEALAADKARIREERSAAFSSRDVARDVQAASKESFLAMLRGGSGD